MPKQKKDRVDLRQFQGSQATTDVLGRSAIQRALESGLTRKQIRETADRQGLKIADRGFEILQQSRQTGKDIDLSQFQGAEAQPNVLGRNAIQRALKRGLSPEDIRKLASRQGYGIADKGLEALANRSGPIRSEKVKGILERTGGDLAKTVDRLAGKDRGLAAGAANLLIRKAGEMPRAGIFGTSGLGQYLQGMAGTAGLTGPRNPQSGYPTYNIPGTPGTGKLGRGLQILPGGKNYGVIRRNVVTPQITPDLGNLPDGPGNANGDPNLNPNPNQELLDAIAALSGELETLRGDFGTLQGDFGTLQGDFGNLYQYQGDLQNQFGDLSGSVGTQIDQLLQDYLNTQQFDDGSAAAAARAFMINQGRMGSGANLQIGANYGGPQLAGTQGFKYRPQTNAAQMATAFLAPTLAAAAMIPQQQLQPTVLNV